MWWDGLEYANGFGDTRLREGQRRDEQSGLRCRNQTERDKMRCIEPDMVLLEEEEKEKSLETNENKLWTGEGNKTQ